MFELQSFAGILYIGDPHVSSKRPGRRKDDYLSSVLGKLAFCAQVCNEQNLLPVIGGDLLHRADENSLRALNQLIAVLKSFHTTPVSLEGNHDKLETSLSEGDALYLLEQSGAVKVISSFGQFGEYLIGGNHVRLVGIPYGCTIPNSLPAGEGIAVAFTHHDLAFGGAYPGAIALKEIEGASMVINGHMHDNKPSVPMGGTVWHNPGNIEPLSVDLAHFVPRAWRWDGDASAPLQGIELPHGTDIWDLTGVRVDAADADQAVSAYLQTVPNPSRFAKILVEQKVQETDAQRTEDVSGLKEDLRQVCEAGQMSDAAQQLLNSLFASLQAEVLQSA